MSSGETTEHVASAFLQLSRFGVKVPRRQGEWERDIDPRSFLYR